MEMILGRRLATGGGTIHASIMFKIADKGGGFNPSLVADPLHPDSLGAPNGRGILLARRAFDEVFYSGVGNTVKAVKHCPPIS